MFFSLAYRPMSRPTSRAFSPRRLFALLVHLTLFVAVLDRHFLAYPDIPIQPFLLVAHSHHVGHLHQGVMR
jgi:hypothetical protein